MRLIKLTFQITYNFPQKSKKFKEGKMEQMEQMEEKYRNI